MRARSRAGNTLRRHSAWLLVLALPVLVAACGSSNKATQTSAKKPTASEPFKLTMTSPSSPLRTHAAHIAIVGSVPPVTGAQVLVDGSAVDLSSDGSFRTKHTLHVGANDVSVNARSLRSGSDQALVHVTRTQTAAERAAAKQRQAVEAARAAAQAEAQRIRDAQAAAQRTERRANRRVLQSAESYLAMSGISKKGLYEQLSSSAGEGFTQAQAQYAVDHVDADWNKEAVQSARSYLAMSPMSRANLIDQLSSSAGEGFTYEQALYAVNKVY